jgi:hypothetical protein
MTSRRLGLATLALVLTSSILGTWKTDPVSTPTAHKSSWLVAGVAEAAPAVHPRPILDEDLSPLGDPDGYSEDPDGDPDGNNGGGAPPDTSSSQPVTGHTSGVSAAMQRLLGWVLGLIH